jgi:hypothetical protein
MTENKDFEFFKSLKSSLFRRIKKYDIRPGELTTNLQFDNAFPALKALVAKARVLDLKFDGQEYKLLSFTDRKENLPCGFLIKFEKDATLLPLLPDHILLLNNIGGVFETYNPPDFPLFLNQYFFFLASLCSQGLGSDRSLYEELCAKKGCIPVETENWIMYSVEANLTKTLYDPVNGEVFLWAPDHNFNFITPLLGQPEYTLYTINGINTFTDYVETLAQQWLEWVL